MSAQATTRYPDPIKIADLDTYIVARLNDLDKAYSARLEFRNRYWRGLPVNVAPSLEEIRDLENHLNECIQEEKRRRI